ncbi:MAG TPA: hypothetical protein IAC57_00270 [Candidatus Scatosoma pullistercoris]|uniref:Uncharacterized protein n=1 Tax=Candidatus Scatosoma pullistercoris TaxID=2840934 RepID=A0A9D1ME16_9FIRM|nr:hypothetical protein [Candidatus Scatosoma pullistercoris]
MRRTEKRGNFRCPMEKCSAGGAEKAPPAPVVPSCRRAVVPVVPVGKGIRARMFQKRRGRGERKEK